MQEMEAGIQNSDVDQVMRAAHTLKSSSAMIGAIALSACCKCVETSQASDALASIDGAVKATRQAMQLVEDEIHVTYLNGEDTPAS